MKNYLIFHFRVWEASRKFYKKDNNIYFNKQYGECERQRQRQCANKERRNEAKKQKKLFVQPVEINDHVGTDKPNERWIHTAKTEEKRNETIIPYIRLVRVCANVWLEYHCLRDATHRFKQENTKVEKNDKFIYRILAKRLCGRFKQQQKEVNLTQSLSDVWNSVNFDSISVSKSFLPLISFTFTWIVCYRWPISNWRHQQRQQQQNRKWFSLNERAYLTWIETKPEQTVIVCIESIVSRRVETHFVSQSDEISFNSVVDFVWFQQILIDLVFPCDVLNCSTHTRIRAIQSKLNKDNDWWEINKKTVRVHIYSVPFGPNYRRESRHSHSQRLWLPELESCVYTEEYWNRNWR